MKILLIAAVICAAGTAYGGIGIVTGDIGGNVAPYRSQAEINREVNSLLFPEPSVGLPIEAITKRDDLFERIEELDRRVQELEDERR